MDFTPDQIKRFEARRQLEMRQTAQPRGGGLQVAASPFGYTANKAPAATTKKTTAPWYQRLIQEGGATGGAVGGAAIGTALLPGIGTIAGAGIGGLLGSFGGDVAESAVRDDMQFNLGRATKNAAVDGVLSAGPLKLAKGGSTVLKQAGKVGLKEALASGADDAVKFAPVRGWLSGKAASTANKTLEKSARLNPTQVTNIEKESGQSLVDTLRSKSIFGADDANRVADELKGGVTQTVKGINAGQSSSIRESLESEIKNLAGDTVGTGKSQAATLTKSLDSLFDTDASLTKNIGVNVGKSLEYGKKFGSSPTKVLRDAGIKTPEALEQTISALDGQFTSMADTLPNIKMGAVIEPLAKLYKTTKSGASLASQSDAKMLKAQSKLILEKLVGSVDNGSMLGGNISEEALKNVDISTKQLNSIRSEIDNLANFDLKVSDPRQYNVYRRVANQLREIVQESAPEEFKAVGKEINKFKTLRDVISPKAYAAGKFTNDDIADMTSDEVFKKAQDLMAAGSKDEKALGEFLMGYLDKASGGNLATAQADSALYGNLADVMTKQANLGRGSGPVGLRTLTAAGAGGAAGSFLPGVGNLAGALIVGGAAEFANSPTGLKVATRGFDKAGNYLANSAAKSGTARGVVAGAARNLSLSDALSAGLPMGGSQDYQSAITTPTTAQTNIPNNTSIPQSYTQNPQSQSMGTDNSGGINDNVMQQVAMQMIQKGASMDEVGEVVNYLNTMKSIQDGTAFMSEAQLEAYNNQMYGGGEPADPLTEGQQKRADVVNSISLVEDAINKGSINYGPIGSRIEGLKSAFNAGDQETVEYKALVSGLRGAIQIARAGASATPGEVAALSKYTPSDTDSLQQLQAKIQGLRQLYGY